MAKYGVGGGGPSIMAHLNDTEAGRVDGLPFRINKYNVIINTVKKTHNVSWGSRLFPHFMVQGPDRKRMVIRIVP